MSSQVEVLEADAMKLTAEERARLADRLIASLSEDGQIEEAWAVEVERGHRASQERPFNAPANRRAAPLPRVPLSAGMGVESCEPTGPERAAHRLPPHLLERPLRPRA